MSIASEASRVTVVLAERAPGSVRERWPLQMALPLSVILSMKFPQLSRELPILSSERPCQLHLKKLPRTNQGMEEISCSGSD